MRDVRAFVRFAVDPSPSTASKVPFAQTVQLGLGRDLQTQLDRQALANASNWTMPADDFRGHAGPLNPLALIAEHAEETGFTDREFKFTVGDHPHCAAPPIQGPRGYERFVRQSVQPTPNTLDSCLSWFTVDLFVDSRGQVEAVTLDVWEP